MSEMVWIDVPPPHEPPELGDWATELQSNFHCRMRGCDRRAVARLYRTNGWWRYCELHLYGRRLDGTTIKQLVAVGSAAHEEAVARLGEAQK